MKEGIRKEYKAQYDASTRRIDVVDVPEFNFIMIDGIGNPNVEEFKLKSEALHLLSKAIKDYFKQELDLLYLISPLEGLWDTYDNSHFDVTRKQMIKYTLMMLQPPILTEEILEEVKAELLAKTNNSYILDVYFKEFEEGECIQMLHIGPYNTEINSTKEIMEYITVANLKLSGFHHEIYLNKPEYVAPENLKTIVRYPVKEDLV